MDYNNPQLEVRCIQKEDVNAHSVHMSSYHSYRNERLNVPGSCCTSVFATKEHPRPWRFRLKRQRSGGDTAFGRTRICMSRHLGIKGNSFPSLSFIFASSNAATHSQDNGSTRSAKGTDCYNVPPYLDTRLDELSRMTATGKAHSPMLMKI